MEKKKTINKKKSTEKSTLLKIAGKAGQLAGSLVKEKNHLVEMAGNAIDSVKEAVHNVTTKEKPLVKKPARKVAKKIVKKVVKKAVKKIAKKAIKKVSGKSTIKK